MGTFPKMICKVPLRDYVIPGLDVRVDHTSTGTVYFVHAKKEIVFPEHSHAAQFTAVVSGKCFLTMNGETKTYQQGDTYYIPAGVTHQITLSAGYAEIDYVDDPND